MRRTVIFLAATSLAAQLAVSPSAQAASGSLTVTTLGHFGGKVTSTVSLLGLSNGQIYSVQTGKSIALPNGRYAVMAAIRDSAVTLGGKIVNVAGKTSVTFDGRRGRAVTVSLDSGPAAGVLPALDVRVCAAPGWFPAAEAGGTAGEVYVIPDPAKELSFAYLAQWPGTEPYIVTGLASGLPQHPGGAFHRAGLADVRVHARTGPTANSQQDVAFQPHPAAGSCLTDLYGEVRNDNAPYDLVAHVSPGQWWARSDTFASVNGQNWDVGATFVTRTFLGAHTYSQVFNQAAWGPRWNLPTISRRVLDYFPDSLVVDPVTGGSDTSTMETVVLAKGGKVLKKRTITQYGNGSTIFTSPINSAGWYTLSVDAHRYYPGLTYPADLLSRRITIDWRFSVDPAKSTVAPVFLTRFVPSGLDGANRAQHGSTTDVALIPDHTMQGPDVPFHPDTAKSIQAWASTDGGTTWQSTVVKHTATGWTTSVPNPAAGTVSLRARVLDANGNSSTVTIYRAYAIS